MKEWRLENGTQRYPHVFVKCLVLEAREACSTTRHAGVRITMFMTHEHSYHRTQHGSCHSPCASASHSSLQIPGVLINKRKKLNRQTQMLAMFL